MNIFDRYEDYDELLYTLCNEFSEEFLSDFLLSAGIVPEAHAKYSGNLDKLVFFFGDCNEVYTRDEISIIEKVENVLVYPDEPVRSNRGVVACRTIAINLEDNFTEQVQVCVALVKIIKKAFDGFSLFLFVFRRNVYFGCNLLSSKKRDWALSRPIDNDSKLIEVLSDLSSAPLNNFIEYYNCIKDVLLMNKADSEETYESIIFSQREYLSSFIDDLEQLGRDLRLNFNRVKQDFFQSLMADSPNKTYAALLNEAEDDMSFIKSKKVNTFEMLFDADEMLRLTIEVEELNAELVPKQKIPDIMSNSSDDEAKELINKPEEMIKLLKKRRGL